MCIYKCTLHTALQNPSWKRKVAYCESAVGARFFRACGHNLGMLTTRRNQGVARPMRKRGVAPPGKCMCDYIHFECAGVAPASQERCCLRSRNLNQSGYCPGCAQERCCPLGENTSVNIYIRCTGVAPGCAREVLPLVAKNRKNHKSFTGSAAVRSTSIYT